MSDPPDFGRTAEDYAHHRAGFPPELLERLAGFGIGGPNERAVDLGTGTGTLARQLALRGGRVVGVDRSAELLAEARRRDRHAGASVRYVVAPAEDTGLPGAHFDVVIAGQCWHWFDRPRAAREVRRLLALDGHAVIAHFDWLPHPGSVVAATETLIEAHNPAWTWGGGTGMYPAWLADLTAVGLDDLETFSFDVAVPYTHDAWRGRIRASAGVGATLAPQAVDAFDTDLARVLRERFPQQPLQIPHRVWAVVGRASR